MQLTVETKRKRDTEDVEEDGPRPKRIHIDNGSYWYLLTKDARACIFSKLGFLAVDLVGMMRFEFSLLHSFPSISTTCKLFHQELLPAQTSLFYTKTKFSQAQALNLFSLCPKVTQ